MTFKSIDIINQVKFTLNNYRLRMIAAMRQESIVFVMVLLFLALMVEKRQYDQNYSLRFSLAHPISPGNGCKYQLSKVSRLILIDFAYFKSFYG